MTTLERLNAWCELHITAVRWTHVASVLFVFGVAVSIHSWLLFAAGALGLFALQTLRNWAEEYEEEGK